MTRPFQRYKKFWTCGLDRDIWPTFEKNFNIGPNFLILRDRAFISGICDPYDKTFPIVP